MKKKILAFVLASAMVVGLGACGNAKKGSGSKESSKAASSAKLNTDTSTLYINLASEPAHLDPTLLMAQLWL